MLFWRIQYNMKVTVCCFLQHFFSCIIIVVGQWLVLRTRNRMPGQPAETPRQFLRQNVDTAGSSSDWSYLRTLASYWLNWPSTAPSLVETTERLSCSAVTVTSPLTTPSLSTVIT